MAECGIYVRAKRDGIWKSVDIATLDDNELMEFFSEREAAELRRWVVTLVGWIRDNVKEMQ